MADSATPTPTLSAPGAASLALARARVVLVIACTAIGFVLADRFFARGVYVPALVSLLCAAACIACAGAAGHPTIIRACLCVGVVTLAFAWWTHRIASVRTDRLDTLLAPAIAQQEADLAAARGAVRSPSRDVQPTGLQTSGVLIAVQGVVVSPPRATNPPAGALGRFMRSEPGSLLRLQVKSLLQDAQEATGPAPQKARRAASGILSVHVSGAPPTCRAGDVVTILGTFRPIERPANPGDELRALRARQDDACGFLRVTDASLITPAQGSWWENATGWALRLRAAAQSRCAAIIDRAADKDPSRRALLHQLLLGASPEQQTDVDDLFTRLGLLHILSISGFHLAVMSLAALWIIRLTGERGMLEPLLVGALVLLYACIVPPTSPVLRSAIFVLALLIVEATGRRYDRLCVLGWVVLALLVARPMDLWSLGFQLSAGLTALLLWAGESFRDALFAPPVKGLIDDTPALIVRARRAFQNALATSIMCWTVALPSIMHASGMVSPLAIIATLIVSPIFVALLWAGYLSLLLGAVLPGTDSISTWCVSGLADIALACARWLDHAPLSALRVPPTPAWWAVPATLAAVLWAKWPAWNAPQRPLRARARWLGVLCVFAAALAGWWWWWLASPPSRVAVRIEQLDVGDGTCIILRCENDAVLWDCKGARRSGTLPGVASAARALGVSRVRRAVITHADMDHFGGLPEVLEPLGIEEVILPAHFLRAAAEEPGGAPGALVAILREHSVRVREASAGDELWIGPARLTFVSPPVHTPWPVDNDNSLVAMVEAPTLAGEPARALLTGDVQTQALRALREVTLPAPDVIEAPHHGAFSDASAQWVAALAPRVVLQSTGPSRVNLPGWAPQRDRSDWRCTALQGWTRVDILKTGEVEVRSMR